MNKYEVYLGDLTCEKIKYSDETVKYGVKTNVIFLNNYKLKEIQESMMKTLYWCLVDKNDLIKLEQELQRKDNIINELKQNKRDYERENILEMKLHILDNNWNELKTYIQMNINATFNINNDNYNEGRYNASCDILDKIKELEEK